MSIQLNEILDECAAGKTKDEQRHIFSGWLKRDPTLPVFLRMAFDPEFKITGIPEGIPDGPAGKPIVDPDIPVGLSFTSLRVDVRRILNFGPKGTMQGLTQARREFLWARQLEGLHCQEAYLLTDIKDGKLLVRYPFLLHVLDLVNITLPDPAEPKTKKPKKEA